MKMLCKLTIFNSKKQQKYDFTHILELLKQHIIFVFALISGLSFSINAQQLSSINYSDENGLPSNNVYSSMQDSKGFMWFATDKGIAKFDGKEFKIFTTTDGLADNECFDMYEDSKHRIWFSSFNGEPSFYYDGKFYSKSNCRFLAKMEIRGPAFKTLEDNNQNIYYLTHTAIYKLNNKNELSKLSLGTLYFSNLCKDSHGRIKALAVLKEKSFLVDVETASRKQLDFQHNERFQISTKSFCTKGKTYFFTNSSELTYVSGSSHRINRINFSSKTEIIQSISVLDEKLYIGTQHGLYISSKTHKDFRHYFKSASITSVLKDRENNFWISTLNEGVYFVINPKINLYDHNQLNFDKIYSINPMDQNSIFIGSDEFKSAFIKKSSIIPLSLNKKGENFNVLVKKIKKIDGHYYFLSGSRSVRLDENFQNPQIIYLSIKDMVINKAKQAYTVGGIVVFKFPLDEFGKYEFGNLRSFDRYGIVKLKSNGIFQVNETTYLVYGLFGVKKIVNSTLQNFNSHQLLGKNIIDIERSPDGVFWFASTVGGLIAVYKNKTFTFDLGDHLPSNYVSSISVGKANQIWLGTNQGISKISYELRNDKISIKTRNYSEQDGVIDNDISDILYQNDTIWIGTKKGLCFVQSDDVEKNLSKPLLSIENIIVGNNQFAEKKEIIKVQPEDNSISFGVKGISFASFGKCIYRYRILGLNPNWKTTKTEQIDLQSLPPGSFQMEIMAIDIFSNPSAIKKIKFEILPFFYQTWWFKIFIAFLSFIGIYFFVQNRLAKIKLNHQLKEKLLTLENDQLKAQTKEISLQKDLVELEQKALMLQMNPHFIFNSINTIQALYKKEREKADDYIVKFSNLLRQILESSKKKVISLDQEIAFLSNYLDINKLRFENEFQYQLNFESSLVPSEIGIAPLIIQPFIENALLHGIQTLKNPGLIQINFITDGDYLICEVIDNGVGRKRSAEINKNKIHVSLGMEITKRRLDFHNNDNSIKSIVILDLFDEQKNSLGTKVQIKMYIDEL